MAAVEILESPAWAPRPRLFVVEPPAPRYVTGRPLTQRRAERARVLSRLRRAVAALAVCAGLGVLAWPGHALGGVTGAGLATDLATSATLASGSLYVVQPGDSVFTIAAAMNPVDPSVARRALVAELGSSVVVAGEHVLIP